MQIKVIKIKLIDSNNDLYLKFIKNTINIPNPPTKNVIAPIIVPNSKKFIFIFC